MTTERSPGRLVLVTGARAAGQTALARALAERLPRAVHIDGDAIAAMVVSGEVPMTLPAPPEAVEQQFLRWLGSIAVAETYQHAGFDAVISDTVVGSFLDDFLDFVSPAPLHLVVLHPSADPLHDAADAQTRRIGLWLDPSAHEVAETVDVVLARLAEARVEADALPPAVVHHE